MEGHRAARKMNFLKYRGSMSSKFHQGSKKGHFKAPLLQFWPLVLSNNFECLKIYSGSILRKDKDLKVVLLAVKIFAVYT